MINLSLFLLPCIAAIIGWLTNYVAVKMLFHPREEVKIGLLRIRGVFPKRQATIAARFGELVATQLLSTDELLDKVKRAVSSPEAQRAISNHIDRLIAEVLPQRIPMLAMMLTPEIQGQIKESLEEVVTPLIIEMVDALGGTIAEQIDVAKTVEHKLLLFLAITLSKYYR